MPIRDTKLNQLILDLERRFDDSIRGASFWYPYYEGGLAADNLDPEMVYSGDIVFTTTPDSDNTEDSVIVTVGSIEDETDAERICDAMNAIPQLLDYIRQLEAQIARPTTSDGESEAL